MFNRKESIYITFRTALYLSQWLLITLYWDSATWFPQPIIAIWGMHFPWKSHSLAQYVLKIMALLCKMGNFRRTQLFPMKDNSSGYYLVACFTYSRVQTSHQGVFKWWLSVLIALLMFYINIDNISTETLMAFLDYKRSVAKLIVL